MSFNKLTDAEAERLALLSEECAEVQQAISKILRHGYDSVNPKRPREGDNRKQLAREIGHVQVAVGMLTHNKDVNETQIELSIETKAEEIRQYLHHQP